MFDEYTPLLAVTPDGAALVSHDEAEAMQASGKLVFLMNAQQALRNFAALCGNDTHCQFDTREMAKITGVSVEHIRYWVSSGIIRPSIKPTSGSGNRRRYSFMDGFIAAIVSAAGRRLLSKKGLRMVSDFLYGVLQQKSLAPSLN